MAEKKYLRDKIYSELAHEIVSGELFPGEKLTDASISKRFGVSRTPVREALMILEKQSFVEYSKHAGATVKKIDVHKVSEIIDICAVLEGRALELAIENDHIEEEGIDYMDSLEESMERFVREGDYANYIKHNVKFHRFVLEKCRSQELQNIRDELNERIFVYRRGGIPPRKADLQKFLQAHREIIAAVRDRDALHARSLLENHVREGRQTLTLNDMQLLVE